ncbi:hypothetical protein B0H13DRAFT_1599678, partial [Mycena leptocephala]
IGVHCGTTSDATFSDCQELVKPETWNSVFNPGNSVCSYSPDIFDREFAYNVACHGNCCVYVARVDESDLPGMRDQIRNEAAGLFGCADGSVNKINGMQQFNDKFNHGTCISDGNGCGDCFDGRSLLFYRKSNSSSSM